MSQKQLLRGSEGASELEWHFMQGFLEQATFLGVSVIIRASASQKFQSSTLLALIRRRHVYEPWWRALLK